MTTPEQRKLRILAVDDEQGVLDIYKTLLGAAEHEGIFSKITTKANSLYGNSPDKEHITQFDLVTCQQGDEAVEQVAKSINEEDPFSVVFLDIRMPPGPDGAWAAQQIHALDPCVNIVIVTAYSDVSPQEIVLKFETPARLFYIQKPFHWNEIYQFAFALSENWKIQRELKNHFQALEDNLVNTTNELHHTKQHAQDMLKGKNNFQEELSLKTQQVEDVNTALRVLLNEKERDKVKIEENIVFNINEYVYPYLVKLRKTDLTARQDLIVSAIEKNITDISSSFFSQEAPIRLKFTPVELQVAKLIKHGSTTKEIAETLTLSVLTIESYRKNIRNKIGLTNKKENLRTWLLEYL
jgi:DNA-binding NarL/FixJ family response regulator